MTPWKTNIYLNNSSEKNLKPYRHHNINQLSLDKCPHQNQSDKITLSIKESFKKINFKTKSTKDFSLIAVIIRESEVMENKWSQNKISMSVQEEILTQILPKSTNLHNIAMIHLIIHLWKTMLKRDREKKRRIDNIWELLSSSV